MLREPRVLFYNDGRHANTYGYEPPMGVRQFREPVDELVDTGVDTLLYCVGDTRVLLYDSKVGERWGHNTGDWNTTVWYRSKVNLEMARAAGMDPLRVVCELANEKGIRILPTLLLDTQAWEEREKTFHGRCSDFCFDHPEYCIDFEGGNYRFNYNLAEVRAERLAIIEEILRDYPSDGIELSYFAKTPFCKLEELGEFRQALTKWMAEIRSIADAAARDQGRAKTIAVRVPAVWDGCYGLGLDLRRWIDEGLVDWIICYTADEGDQIDQDMPLEPFVKAVDGSECRVFAGIAATVGNDWYTGATREMFHAAAANAYSQGAAGVALYNFWPTAYPYSDSDYGILRQIGHPELLERKDKRFRARSKTSREFWGEAPLGYQRPLPVTLEVGRPGPEVPIRVADDVAAAAGEGCLDSVTLITRVTDICPADSLRFYFNGEELPVELARLEDYTYKIGYARVDTRIGSHYWFDFLLPANHWPRPGVNVFRVDLIRREAALARFMPVTVHDVEIWVRYRPHRHAPRQFERYADAR